MKQDFKLIKALKRKIEDEPYKGNMFEKEKFKELNGKEAREFIKQNYGGYGEEYKQRVEKMKKNLYQYNVEYFSDPVKMYGGHVHVDINNRLRKGFCEGSVEERMNWRIDSVIDKMQEIILYAPRLQDDVVLYRAVDDDAIKKIQIQMDYDVYVDKGIVSTSLSMENDCDAFKTSNNIIKIYAEKGSVALGIDCIRDRGELEILLPSNSKFLFLGKKKNVYEFMLINPNIDELRDDSYEEHIKVMRASEYKYRNKELEDVRSYYASGNSIDVTECNNDEQKEYYLKAKRDKYNELIYCQKPLVSEVSGYLRVNTNVIREIEECLADESYYEIKDTYSAYKCIHDIKESGDIIKIVFKRGNHVICCKDDMGRERVLFPDEMYITRLNKQDDYYLAEIKNVKLFKKKELK